MSKMSLYQELVIEEYAPLLGLLLGGLVVIVAIIIALKVGLIPVLIFFAVCLLAAFLWVLHIAADEYKEG